MNIIETLKRFDRVMRGNETYEHAWINYPDKPELTPAKLLRSAIKQHKESTLASGEVERAIIHAYETGYITGHNDVEAGKFKEDTHAAAVEGSAGIISALHAPV